jgi:hypothetical protein
VPDRSDDYQEALPPRLLRADERSLVEEWLALAGDVSSAYVSTRLGDNPKTYRKIVITVEGDGEPTYLIDTPLGTDIWIVVTCRPIPDACEFQSLREALNFVRPVLQGEPDTTIKARHSSNPKRL